MGDYFEEKMDLGPDMAGIVIDDYDGYDDEYFEDDTGTFSQEEEKLPKHVGASSDRLAGRLSVDAPPCSAVATVTPGSGGVDSDSNGGDGDGGGDSSGNGPEYQEEKAITEEVEEIEEEVIEEEEEEEDEEYERFNRTEVVDSRTSVLNRLGPRPGGASGSSAAAAALQQPPATAAVTGTTDTAITTTKTTTGGTATAIKKGASGSSSGSRSFPAEQWIGVAKRLIFISNLPAGATVQQTMAHLRSMLTGRVTIELFDGVYQGCCVVGLSSVSAVRPVAANVAKAPFQGRKLFAKQMQAAEHAQFLRHKTASPAAAGAADPNTLWVVVLHNLAPTTAEGLLREAMLHEEPSLHNVQLVKNNKKRAAAGGGGGGGGGGLAVVVAPSRRVADAVAARWHGRDVDGRRLQTCALYRGYKRPPRPSPAPPLQCKRQSGASPVGGEGQVAVSKEGEKQAACIKLNSLQELLERSKGPACRVSLHNVAYTATADDVSRAVSDRVGGLQYILPFRNNQGCFNGNMLLEFFTPAAAKKFFTVMQKFVLKQRQIFLRMDTGVPRDLQGNLLSDLGSKSAIEGPFGKVRFEGPPPPSSHPGRPGVGPLGEAPPNFGPPPMDLGPSGHAPHLGDFNGSPTSLMGGRLEPMGPPAPPFPQMAVHDTFGLSPEYLANLGIELPLVARVLVSHVDPRATDNEVGDLLSVAGTVLTVLVNRNLQQAIVEMAHPVEAVEAVSRLHQHPLRGQRLAVRLCRRRDFEMVNGLPLTDALPPAPSLPQAYNQAPRDRPPNHLPGFEPPDAAVPDDLRSSLSRPGSGAPPARGGLSAPTAGSDSARGRLAGTPFWRSRGGLGFSALSRGGPTPSGEALSAVGPRCPAPRGGGIAAGRGVPPGRGAAAGRVARAANEVEGGELVDSTGVVASPIGGDSVPSSEGRTLLSSHAGAGALGRGSLPKRGSSTATAGRGATTAPAGRGKASTAPAGRGTATAPVGRGATTAPTFRGRASTVPAGRGGITTAAAGRGGATTAPTGRGGATTTPAGRGGATTAPAGRGGATTAPAGRGRVSPAPAGKGASTAPAGKGASTAPAGRGASTVPAGRGRATTAPAGRGGATTTPAGRGGATTAPAGRGDATTAPAGRGGDATAPAGRGGASTAPAGRGGATTTPAGRGGDTTAPAGREGATAAPTGRGGATTTPAGRGGDTTAPAGREGATAAPTGVGGTATSTVTAGISTAPAGTSKTSSDSKTPAGTSTTPAGTSTTPAGTSTTPAGTSTTPAGTSTTPAGTSTTPAGTNKTPATTSTTSAGTSIAPAGTSTTSAGTNKTPVTTSTTPAGTVDTSSSSAVRDTCDRRRSHEASTGLPAWQSPAPSAPRPVSAAGTSLAPAAGSPPASEAPTTGGATLQAEARTMDSSEGGIPALGRPVLSTAVHSGSTAATSACSDPAAVDSGAVAVSRDRDESSSQAWQSGVGPLLAEMWRVASNGAGKDLATGKDPSDNAGANVHSEVQDKVTAGVEKNKMSSSDGAGGSEQRGRRAATVGSVDLQDTASGRHLPGNSLSESPFVCRNEKFSSSTTQARIPVIGDDTKRLGPDSRARLYADAMAAAKDTSSYEEHEPAKEERSDIRKVGGSENWKAKSLGPPAGTCPISVVVDAGSDRKSSTARAAQTPAGGALASSGDAGALLADGGGEATPATSVWRRGSSAAPKPLGTTAGSRLPTLNTNDEKISSAHPWNAGGVKRGLSDADVVESGPTTKRVRGEQPCGVRLDPGRAMEERSLGHSRDDSPYLRDRQRVISTSQARLSPSLNSSASDASQRTFRIPAVWRDQSSPGAEASPLQELDNDRTRHFITAQSKGAHQEPKYESILGSFEGRTRSNVPLTVDYGHKSGLQNAQLGNGGARQGRPFNANPYLRPSSPPRPWPGAVRSSFGGDGDLGPASRDPVGSPWTAAQTEAGHWRHRGRDVPFSRPAGAARDAYGFSDHTNTRMKYGDSDAFGRAGAPTAGDASASYGGARPPARDLHGPPVGATLARSSLFAPSQSAKLVINNLPGQLSKRDISELCGRYGVVREVDHDVKAFKTRVLFANAHDARVAAQALNDFVYRGSTLRALVL